MTLRELADRVRRGHPKRWSAYSVTYFILADLLALANDMRDWIVDVRARALLDAEPDYERLETLLARYDELESRVEREP